MEGNIRIVGIELGLLAELLRTIVRQEMVEMRDEIKQTLISKQESLMHEERLHTEDVAKILGVTRHTILNYRKSGALPKPLYDISKRPYWSPDQLERATRLRGIKMKFPV